MEEVMDEIYHGETPKQLDEFQMIRDNSEMIIGLNKQLRSALNERNILLRQRFSRELLHGIKINKDKYPAEWYKDVNYAVAVIEFIPDTFDKQDENLLLYKNEIISYTQLSSEMMYVSLNYYTYAIIIESLDQKKVQKL